MRIIAGSYRGRVIKGPPDHKTRPTSDRLRESIFNILHPRIDDGTRFCDICAGTGAIGIEALSRGCSFVTFVDISRRSCALIEENLDLLGIEESRTDVICMPAETFAGREHSPGWDIIYFDPPYDFEHKAVLLELASSKALRPGGVLLVEHHSKSELPDAVRGLRRWRILKQGESSVSFYEYD